MPLFRSRRRRAISDELAGRQQSLAAIENDDRGSSVWGSITIFVALFFVAAITWSAFATVDELSRADGKVIPSGKTKIIQSAEAGVVLEILVREGEKVREDQVLMRLDDTGTSSSLGEVAARIRTLSASTVRLHIEHSDPLGTEYRCPPEVAKTVPAICDNEAKLLESRYDRLSKSRGVLVERLEQRKRELAEAHSNVERLRNNLELAQSQFDLIKPLADKNLISNTELIQSQRDVADLTGQLSTSRETIGRVEAGLREAQIQLEQAEAQFREEALTLLTEKLSELSVAVETERGAADRVFRSDIRSPVDGIVSKLDITTVGAFVSAGTKVMDVVPVDDKLLVEAKLKPSDIAFVLPGQKANIKLTAYDFSIYGGLEGVVDTVSADSYFDENTKETFYSVIVKTDQSDIEYHDKKLPILPGMVTQVEILTGSKTILNYLLKPINKARNEALTER